MINLDAVKITPRGGEVCTCLPKDARTGNRPKSRHQSAHGDTAFAYVVLRTGITEGRKRAKVATAGFCEGANGVMQPRDQLDPWLGKG